ncbi:hypothetical protein ACNPG5_18795 [Citrobacter cronae]|uniref:hypothetical protein n=1 Tax=Citrobacter cronae TaxID=1748967 RepID=UPI003AA97F90
MRKIYSWIFLLSILAVPSAYAGCYAPGNLLYFWGPPSSKIEINFSQNNITTDTPTGTKIGTMNISFSCPYYVGSGYWNNDNYLGGTEGFIYVPLPEFNFVNNYKVEHKSGLIYLQPEGYANSYAKFWAPNSHAWNFTNISATFPDAMGRSQSNKTGPILTYGIYTNSIGGNVPSRSEVVSMLTAATGNNINYRAGGNSPTSKHLKPSITNNSVTLNYTNTVTCSVTSNTNNIDLGVVNINGDMTKPLATIVLTMKCGLGLSGGNMTSNYSSFIIPGSTYININSPDAQNIYNGDFKLHVGNGWGVRFDTNQSQLLNINGLNNITIPVYPFKYWADPGRSADWKGAVNFIINYN